MTKRLLAGLVLTICSIYGVAAAAAPDEFIAEAEGTGKAVLWFFGQEVTADVRARVALSGTLRVNGATMSFAAEALAVGSGSGNTNTLAVDAWVAVRGEGKTESGAPITLEGGISVDALAPATASTSGQGTGRFLLLITTPDGRWIVEGEAAGSATGAFAVPADPNTMELDGAGSFSLSGKPQPWAPAPGTALPADWPAKLLAELVRQAALTAGGPPR